MALTPSTLLPTAEALRYKPVLALLLSCHCPFVKHCEAEISRLQVDLGDRALLIGIASNSSRSFPYRLDTSQALARAFQAACTPDPFQPPRHGLPSDGRDLRAALGPLSRAGLTGQVRAEHRGEIGGLA
jgi:hypothetical protein